MAEMLNLNEAAQYLEISRKLLDSLRKNGLELEAVPVGRRLKISKISLDEWLEKKKRTTIMLDRDDLVKAFKFALKINYSGHPRSDFGSARQRSVEQAVINWTQGALSEIALSKYIMQKYNIEVVLDFEFHPGIIVGQDITAVIKNRVENPPRKRVSIKSGKPNGMYLIVPQNELERPDRTSDFYVFVRIWLPNDFLFRLFRKQPELSDVEIPELEDFPAQIVGYTEKERLRKTDRIPGVEFSGFRYVLETGKLRNSEDDFRDFVESL